MDEQLLTILKLCLLALLYLFFFRVLRAVWAEIRAPKPALAPAGMPATPKAAAREARRAERKAPPVHLAIVSPPELKGRAFPLGDEVTFVPGHGRPSTFGRERESNPFVGDAVLAASR